MKKLYYHSFNLAKEAYANQSDRDIIGDYYEALMGYFASNAGKKGGEFYTPSEVSKLMAKLVTNDVTSARAISDPTCGSGSLLIKVAKELEAKGGNVGTLYGQEQDHLTSRLAKMNMCIHNISNLDFSIECCDTLNIHDTSEGKYFDITVANPPYSIKWDNGEYHYDDPRFLGYGALAPKGTADLAFLQHIIYHMTDTGRAAVLLPLGVLFRGNAEEKIRTALIDTYNVIDSVIQLPSNLFYGASIPVCCIILRKDRGDRNDILMINASDEFIKSGNKNALSDDNIFNVYKDRTDIPYFSAVVDREIIRNNKYNLNIPLYIEAEKITEQHDLSALFKEFSELDNKERQLKESINLQLQLFGIEQRFTM